MVAKLNLQKAFYSINHGSLLYRLYPNEFTITSIKWIKACISKVPFSIILNGEIKGFFHSSNGLRYGCPLLPLLFIISIDVFSTLLSNEMSLEIFIPFSFWDCHVSHLLFAYNLLAVSKANISIVLSLKSSLDCLYNYMRLDVNYSKPMIYYSNKADIWMLIENFAL